MVKKNVSSSRRVEFKLYAPEAKKVSLAGSFNNWQGDKKLVRRKADGSWKVRLNLKPGEYEYKFIVDGVWVEDPNCCEFVPNIFGTRNCIVKVK